MKRFQFVVIGGTRAGSLAADALSGTGRSVALVRTEGDDEADRIVAALDDTAPTDGHPVRFEILSGPARFLSRHRLSLPDGEIEADRVVIAVGAVPTGEWDLGAGPFPRLLDALTKPVAGSALVLGAGPGAVVAADRLARGGTRVTLVTRSARVLPLEDESVSAAIAGRLATAGAALRTGASALAWAPSGVTRWTADGAPHDVKTDTLFPETDLRAATAGLDLAKAGVYVDVMGSVVVDEEMRTSAPGIWAAGHAVAPGGSQAEHTHQAELAAHNAKAGFLGKMKAEPATPPIVIRTSTPAARVGLTESEARRRFNDVASAVTPGIDGLVKIVGRRRGGRLLGAHVVGPGAAETILFFDLLLRAEIPLGDVPDRRHFPMPGTSDAVYRALKAWSAAAFGE